MNLAMNRQWTGLFAEESIGGVQKSLKPGMLRPLSAATAE
jgi:hypothetical protein